MLKSTAYLCAALYLTLLVGGRDDPRLAAEAATPVVSAKLGGSVLTTLRPAPALAEERLAQDRLAQDRLAQVPEPTLPAGVPPLAATDPGFWQVTADRLNVRKGPSTENPVVWTLDRGEEVAIAEDNGGKWVKIRIEGDGTEGWVSRQFVSRLQ